MGGPAFFILYGILQDTPAPLISSIPCPIHAAVAVTVFF